MQLFIALPLQVAMNIRCSCPYKAAPSKFSEWPDSAFSMISLYKVNVS